MVIVANMDFPFKLIFVMVMLPIISATAYNNNNNNNVTLGSVLVSGETNSTWASPSGEFAFGFRQFGVKRYMLAVVFDEIRQKTIAWSLNGHNYVAGLNWTLGISANGLVLSDSHKNQIWAAKVSGVAYGALLDNGNFVLAGHDSEVLWQSFDHPTDTLLPGQVLKGGRSLFSSKNETDHSRGAFELKMQEDGNLVLHRSNSTASPKWASNTTNTGAVRAVFTELGQLYLAAENGSIIKDIFPKSKLPATQFYQRLTLDPDGVVYYYTFNKSAHDAWFVQTNEMLGN